MSSEKIVGKFWNFGSVFISLETPPIQRISSSIKVCISKKILLLITRPVVSQGTYIVLNWTVLIHKSKSFITSYVTLSAPSLYSEDFSIPLFLVNLQSLLATLVFSRQKQSPRCYSQTEYPS